MSYNSDVLNKMSLGCLIFQDVILTTPRFYMSSYFWFCLVFFIDKQRLFCLVCSWTLQQREKDWWGCHTEVGVNERHSTPDQRCKLKCINWGGFTEYGWGTRATTSYLMSERVLKHVTFLDYLILLFMFIVTELLWWPECSHHPNGGVPKWHPQLHWRVHRNPINQPFALPGGDGCLPDCHPRIHGPHGV